MGSPIQIIVRMKSGITQLERNIHPLLNLLKGTYPANTRLRINFEPSLYSQLTDTSVGRWTRLLGIMYSKLSNIDLSVGFQPTLDANKPPMMHIDLDNLSEGPDMASLKPQRTDQIYMNVVLGGTFDRIHAGHRILLSTALLRCQKSVTVGVTSSSMLGRKTLSDLIEPVESRISGVNAFIEEVNEGIQKKVVEITDPFGPAGVDPDLECIIGSEESGKGCEAVNQKRSENGLNPLDVHLIRMVEDDQREGDHEEEKISSSSGRIRLLGTRLKPAFKDWNRNEGPYVIGLTGGSASGKSSIGKRFLQLGAGLVDCDKLGHEAYKPGTETFKALVNHFGDQIVADDGSINRRNLGGIVFADKKELHKLNEIVWPQIQKMAIQSAQKQWHEEGKKIVILDAAVLLEAGWQRVCNEVWVAIINREEAVKRIMERDGKTQAEAENRINNQLTNADRCKEANTVFCTQWDPSVTQKQVEKAWSRLNTELELSNN